MSDRQSFWAPRHIYIGSVFAKSFKEFSFSGLIGLILIHRHQVIPWANIHHFTTTTGCLRTVIGHRLEKKEIKGSTCWLCVRLGNKASKVPMVNIKTLPVILFRSKLIRHFVISTDTAYDFHSVNLSCYFTAPMSSGAVATALGPSFIGKLINHLGPC